MTRKFGFLDFGDTAGGVVLPMDLRDVAAIAAAGGVANYTVTVPSSIPTYGDPDKGLVGSLYDQAVGRGGYFFQGAGLTAYLTAAARATLLSQGSLYFWVNREFFKAPDYTALPIEQILMSVPCYPGTTYDGNSELYFMTSTPTSGSNAPEIINGRNTGNYFGASPNGQQAFDPVWDLLPEWNLLVYSWDRAHSMIYVNGQMIYVGDGVSYLNNGGQSPQWDKLILSGELTQANVVTHGLKYPSALRQFQISTEPVHLMTPSGPMGLVAFFGGTEVRAGSVSSGNDYAGTRLWSNGNQTNNKYVCGLVQVALGAGPRNSKRLYPAHISGTGASSGNLTAHVATGTTSLKGKGAFPGIAVIDYCNGDFIGAVTVATHNTNMVNGLNALIAYNPAIQIILVNSCSYGNYPTFNTQAYRDRCDGYNANFRSYLTTYPDNVVAVVDAFTATGGHTPDASMFQTGAGTNSDTLLEKRGHYVVGQLIAGEIEKLI